jgi:hypothetical protein
MKRFALPIAAAVLGAGLMVTGAQAAPMSQAVKAEKSQSLVETVARCKRVCNWHNRHRHCKMVCRSGRGHGHRHRHHRH